MAETFDLIVRGGQAWTTAGLVPADIGVRGGRFAALGDLGTASAGTVIDAAGLTVLPGVIDTQVHFREPGLEHKEDLESGTRGAVLGGVTAVFEMPNTKPSTLNADDLQAKLTLARGRAWCDHAFYMGGSAENVEQLPVLERLPGCCGVKVFMGASTGTLLVPDDATLDRILAHGTRRMAVHCEDEARMNARKALAQKPGVTAHLHPVVRDMESALLATQRLIRLARKHGRRVHVLHVTTEDEMLFLRDHKDVATVEATPQHLTLAAPDCYDRLGTLAQMNPPIRETHHREGLWRAVRDGTVDVIGSDHAPHTREEKAKPYPDSPSGMPGVQTLLPLLLDHLNAGRLSLARLVDLTSAGAARIFGLAAKGRIALGYDADLTLVDLGARREISDAWMATKSGWTPFAGMTVTGWPMATIIRGNVVMRDGELLGRPIGTPIRFVETLSKEG
ncbi:dihydroorotase [Vineibacter terrae]|uniref:dihydroorotase n=1 Tax=Vineibacter terrae TaxID=2586908 RepID=UPI002E3485EF|nr:dihydroorotase [Vineibacter terrae]HEX2891831.1 dihydroorotase [Vineibacter terrae]